jgi:hypothetical protein
MNPHCLIDTASFTITRDGKYIDLDPVVGCSCPALIYIATPYIIAMKNGVRFPWEKHGDSVLVTCPAGHVDFEVRDIHENTFCATILRQDGGCPKHTLNDIIKVPIQESEMKLFNDVFPFLFHTSAGDSIDLHGNISIKKAGIAETPPPREIVACDMQTEIDNADLLVDVEGMIRTCAYNRKLKTFLNADLAPAGLCTFAYNAAYPAFLAMLYGKGLPNSVGISCPGTRSRVEFALDRKARVIKRFLDILEKVLSFTPFRLDLIKYRVKLKVIATEGTCEKHMKVGNSYALGNKRLLCPSSFYSLFPALISRLGKHDRPACKCTCTSVPCRISYRLSSKSAKKY